MTLVRSLRVFALVAVVAATAAAAEQPSASLADRTQRIAWLQRRDLAGAREEISGLLHNVLPPSIADRKLKGEAPIADDYREASLLFADVVDFTVLSGRLRSTQVVGVLGELFGRYDRIAQRYGLEKIKTIGDCYMLASGIPLPDSRHLENLAHAALEMLAETSYVVVPDGGVVTVRIGMHTGPVTAGVIGDSKFIFDVWGDTVNTASRMESHGRAGRIHVTEPVRTGLAHSHVFDGPVVIDVKGQRLGAGLDPRCRPIRSIRRDPDPGVGGRSRGAWVARLRMPGNRLYCGSGAGNRRTASAMQTVVCMKWGSAYSADYVNRLHRGVRRHIVRPTRFVCFTDDPAGLDDSIEPMPMPEIRLPATGMRRGPWRKLGLWVPGLGGLTGDVLFLDLDVVVTGPLEDFFDYEPGALCLIRNWTQLNDGIGNSSVMRFPVGGAPHLVEDFERDAVAMSFRYTNEQIYLTRESRLQTSFWPPEWCPSFKHVMLPRWPRNLWREVPPPGREARVVVFTGHPRPHDAARGAWPARWYKKFYKTLKPVTWLQDHWH